LAAFGEAVDHLMADQSDVENALVELVFTALYPLGTSSPSVVGPACRIYRGWPNPSALDADLAAGCINVTIFPAEGQGRTTTRYPQEWQVLADPSPTLTVTVVDNAATFAGSADAGQLAGLRACGASYVYATQPGDTPALVAAALADQVRANTIAHLSGTTVSVPAAWDFLARTVASAPAVMEIRRQTRNFRITCWCPDPATRDIAASAIDVALAPLRFLTMPDGAACRLLYEGGTVIDRSQDAALYRRDLIYSVEYPTMLAAEQPAMLFGAGLLNATSFIG
jgi:hypothetical protein